ncbi:MAG: efflux RND transporter periplasmic adaptor subunit [Alphaproteobacteria bacterium]|nr:efflux RND transporter periplasmic adaptor subunit [Alphaproteobacteria bacterium]
MRRWLPALVLIGTLLAFVGTLGFLWQKSQAPPTVFTTESPVVTDIVKKTVATGAIVPRNEIALKPQVSGIIESIAVEPGDVVTRGDLIARIQVIPNSGQLASAQAQVRAAELNLSRAQQELGRSERLHDQGVLSDDAMDAARVAFQLREQELASARTNLRIIREGAIAGSGGAATEVRATVGGMILSVPVKEGESVIESNTFNAGTTIAYVADMSDMIFQGKVDESEVGKISVGMPLDITIGALQDRRFAGTLEYIAPKGELDEGAVKFEIRAALAQQEGVFVRAGVSANADIVLDHREQVLAVKEALLQFEEDAVFVEVETAPQTFERRDVEVGLSDGIHVEIVSGVTEADKLKGREESSG